MIYNRTEKNVTRLSRTKQKGEYTERVRIYGVGETVQNRRYDDVRTRVFINENPNRIIKKRVGTSEFREASVADSAGTPKGKGKIITIITKRKTSTFVGAVPANGPARKGPRIDFLTIKIVTGLNDTGRFA